MWLSWAFDDIFLFYNGNCWDYYTKFTSILNEPRINYKKKFKVDLHKTVKEKEQDFDKQPTIYNSKEQAYSSQFHWIEQRACLIEAKGPPSSIWRNNKI